MPDKLRSGVIWAIISAMVFSTTQARAQHELATASFYSTDLSCKEVEERARSVMMGRVLKLSYSDLRRHMGKTQLDLELIEAVMKEDVIQDFVGSHDQVLAFGRSWFSRCELGQIER